MGNSSQRTASAFWIRRICRCTRCIVAAWAISQAFRRKESPFTNDEKRFVRFWAIAGLICLLFAFGRHAPFYWIIYKLPYFSTMRNPIKFMNPFHISLLILFAYGLEGISRLYLEKAFIQTRSLRDQLKGWWAAAAVFDKRWTIGLCLCRSECPWLPGLFFVFSGAAKPSFGRGISPYRGPGYSFIQCQRIRLVPLVSFSLSRCTGLTFSGYFSGRRAKFASLILGLILVSDLVRANLPWIRVVNYKENYALDPIADFLRRNPTKAGLPCRAYQSNVQNSKTPSKCT